MSQTTEVRFDLPDDVTAGLLRGDLAIQGGVVRWAAGNAPGKSGVYAWLKPLAERPSDPSTITKAIGSLTPWVGAATLVSSVVGIGVTAHYGRKLSRQLDTVHASVEALHGKADATHASVEALHGKADATHASVEALHHRFQTGLEYLSEQLSGLDARLDAQMLATLRMAAKQADMASSERDPASSARRMTGLPEKVHERIEELSIGIEKEMEAVVLALKQRVERDRLTSLDGAEVRLLDRIRLFAWATSLYARTCAAGQERLTRADVAAVRDWSRAARNWVNRIGQEVLADRGEDDFVYDDLLNAGMAQAGIPPERVEAWAKRFDPRRPRLADILRLMQKSTGQLTPSNGTNDVCVSPQPWFSPKTLQLARAFPGDVARPSPWPPESVPVATETPLWAETVPAQVARFGDALDGAWEDLERLDGQLLEYDDMLDSQLSLAEYSAYLEPPDHVKIPADAVLAIIVKRTGAP